jgi:hypothetical protein
MVNEIAPVWALDTPQHAQEIDPRCSSDRHNQTQHATPHTDQP